MRYWYNVRTGRVEAHDDPARARGGDLMGPYETEDEAARALERARARTEAWDEEDRAEAEWRSGDPDARRWDSNPLNG